MKRELFCLIFGMVVPQLTRTRFSEKECLQVSYGLFYSTPMAAMEWEKSGRAC